MLGCTSLLNVLWAPGSGVWGSDVNLELLLLTPFSSSNSLLPICSIFYSCPTVVSIFSLFWVFLFCSSVLQVSDVFFWACVCVCACMSVHRYVWACIQICVWCMCLHGCEHVYMLVCGWTPKVLFGYHTPFYPLRQGLSLGPELPDLARLLTNELQALPVFALQH